MDNPEQAFVKYASLRTDEAGAEEEVEEGSEEELKVETEEGKEDDPEYFDTFPKINELRYHEWILKNPRPPWVSVKIKTGDMDSIKIECMAGQFLKKQAYIDL
ncbi:hypothetical protein Tco_0598825 [Tanacetum coccineum]